MNVFARDLLTVFVLGVGTAASAQLTSIGLEKFQDFTQTSSATPSTVDGYHFNFTYGGSATGLDAQLIAPGAATVFGPGQLQKAEWAEYANSAFNAGSGRPALPNGTYTISVGPNGGSLASVSVGMTGDRYTGFVPAVSGSGLTWNAGSLTLNGGVSNTFNFNTGSFAASGYALESVTPSGGSVSFLIYSGGSPITGQSWAAFLGDTAPNSFTLNAGALAAGTYEATLEYNIFSDIKNTPNAIGAPAYALFGSQTHFTITVIPEPAQCAMAFGIAALAFLGVRQRPRKRTELAD